jgi:thiamine pyrophosphokinase
MIVIFIIMMAQGTTIVQSRDQDTTDLEKCLLHIKNIENQKGQMVPYLTWS